MINFFKVALLFLFSTISILLYSQNNISLNDKFKKYDIVDLNARSIYQELQTKRYGGRLTLNLNENYSWDLNLANSGLISKDYVLNVATEDGIKTTYGTTALPMEGYVNNQPNSRVSLTFNDDFIYGFVQIGYEMIFIEPLRHYRSDASNDAFIVYNTKDVISSRDLKCGYEQYQKEMDKHRNDNHSHNGNASRANQCLLVEVNLAADYSMVQKYGSVSGAESHNLGVLNNVKTNYDDEFADELRFQLNEQWISSCSTCDPWSSSTDPGVLLNSFTGWAPGGFSTSHDVASLWSNRDFNGSTVGLAWVGTVCTNYKYNVLQDFTSDGDLKRCMQAHELGHNFNADHSSVGIMAPTVSHDNFWEQISKTQIQNYYGGIYCLSSCAPSNPPVANFTYQVVEQCIPAQVQFTNTSTYATSYYWEFPGGTPATSTQKDPLVYYNSSGTYSVSLTAYNGSQNNKKTVNITVNTKSVPTPHFTYTVNGYEVSFVDGSIGATSWEWHFGDGTSPSYVQNPKHTYAHNGVYNALLIVSNECGTVEFEDYIVISVAPTVNFTSNVNTGCNPLTVNFLNQTKDGQSFLWTFPGGNPATSTDENPIVVYNNPGTYNVTLEATNGAGTNTKTITEYIVVSPSPVPGFTSSKNGSTVTFTDMSSFGTSYSWNFGDGATSSDQNPVHTYADNGTYTVTQTVTNGCSTKTQTASVVIAVAPVPSFTSNYTGPICAGQSVQFTNTSTYSPTTFAWVFEGGTPATSTDANPLIQYNTGGSFKVTLTVTNAYGSNQIVLNNYVVVDTKPVVSFSTQPDGLKIDFTQSISGSNNQSWDFGDGSTSTDANPSHTYAAEGTYTVKLSANNRCGITEYSKVIQVVLLPTADFGANKTNVCPGDTVFYENMSSSSATSWSWTFDGGVPATSTDKNPVVVYGNAGTYNVSLTVTNPSGQGSVTKSNFVHVIAPVTASFTGNTSGNQIELFNTGFNSSSSSWNVFNDKYSTTASGDTAVVTVPANGVYSVILTNSNQCGTAVSDTLHFTVTGYPEASFTANGGGILCQDQVVNFVANGGVSYSWQFEGGNPSTSTESIQDVTYSSTGTHLVVLIATNSYGKDTLRSFVTINTKPKADFDYAVNAEDVKFTLTGSGQASQLWNFGDGSTSTDLNPEHTYTASGQYTVMLITSNGCGSDTITRVLGITVAVSDIQAQYGIKIYPNPAKDFIQVQIDRPLMTECTLQLMSSTGHIIREQKVLTEQKQIIFLDVTDVADGMYILNVKTDKVVIPNKIFILR